ncbi:MAG: uracil-DNA glycosylase, partial [Pseudomonadota bacterium]
FDPYCRLCPRLATFLDETKEKYPDYHCGPGEPFGDKECNLLIVGLAPGMHGANATGRPFTGDYAGVLLYQTLFDLGLSNQPEAVRRQDGLALRNCRLTNAVKCLPPQNKPVGAEINTCNQFLAREIEAMPSPTVVLALGVIAHNAVLKALGLKLSTAKFAHGAVHEIEANLTLVDTYHCSRYNTNTRRLTEEMFVEVVTRAKELAEA